MSYRLLTIAVLLLIAPAGCCQPCCPRACTPTCAQNCGPCRASMPAQAYVPHGGVRGQLLSQWSHAHAWFKPPRPAEITPPQPRFHPVPARPVFEYPPDDLMPASAQTPPSLQY